MPPFWPFKRSSEPDQVDEAPPAPVVYKKGEDPNRREAAVSVDATAYTDALALFGDGSSDVHAASDQTERYDGIVSGGEAERDDTASASSEPTHQDADDEVADHSWVHHSDGYHYKRLSDGSFEPTAYTKNEDGTYTPYA